jgi:hypothetical protein
MSDALSVEGLLGAELLPIDVLCSNLELARRDERSPIRHPRTDHPLFHWWRIAMTSESMASSVS